MEQAFVQPVSAQASQRRPIGAMIFAVFGSLWLLSWNYYSGSHQTLFNVLIVACGIAIIAWAVSIDKRVRSTLTGIQNDQDSRLTNKAYHLINAAQWLAIFIGINLLNKFGLATWNLPLIVLIVGLHFFPLARLFHQPKHYLTGAYFVLLAVLFPLCSANGPSDVNICLGAGIGLWISALWNLFEIRQTQTMKDLPHTSVI
ncbi:hypothetical protein H8K32_08095 [Undibacterium jejuense]|uniref:Uncharacterized protein n=1 Tax=Undibacterium jejuense TaxID=1344949 RepID=A0A923HGM5_9BURK|nr:hypothetical protein [Undibacterium jejuense]MBC3862053.1 hypothetical protein [Undibacterium jejuense]